MTEITSTKTQPRVVLPQQEKTSDTSASRKKTAVFSDQENLHAVVSDLKIKRIDFLFSVQSEAKTTFAWQKGILDRAAAHGVDLGQLQYEGKPLTELTQAEASRLIAEDGFFGVTQTSQRLADFVVTGGGNDLARVQAGREGIIKGFKDAEEIWGGKLPEISYKTLDKALEMIDARIRDLGGGTMVDVLA